MRRGLRAVALTLVLPAVMTAAPAHASAPDDFRVTGHRGVIGVRGVTENTVPALARARRDGATAAEIDVRLTQDAQLVLMHDASLSRTTTCDGYVHRRTLAWIRERCRAESGARIPTFARVLRWAAEHETNLVVELKSDPDRRWSDTLLEQVAALVRARGMWERTRVFSASPSLLSRLEDLDPGWRTHGLVRTGGSSPSALAAQRGEALSLAAEYDGVTVCAELLHAYPDLLAQLRNGGDLVLGRESLSESDWAVYRKAGVDGVLVDRPATYHRWRSGTPGRTAAVPDGRCRAY